MPKDRYMDFWMYCIAACFALCVILVVVIDRFRPQDMNDRPVTKAHVESSSINMDDE